MIIKLEEQPFGCVHCGKAFMKEKTLYAHMCEPKRRAMQKDEKRVQAGFLAFNKFFRLTQGAKKDKTYDDFCKSPYYNAFVKFGSFVNNVMPLYPEKFMDFVIRSGVKLDHWCRDELYDTYLFEMLKVEPVEAAVQRSLKHMMEWADSNNAEFQHYFLYVNLNRAVNDIRNGYISPWLVLNCRSGRDMVGKFNDEQMDIIEPAFDVQYWLAKFKDHPADASLVKEVCKETGID